MELDANVLDPGMPDIILGEAYGSIVVAENCGAAIGVRCMWVGIGFESKAVEELAKEDHLLTAFVERDVLCIAWGVCHDVLFLWAPRDESGTQGEAVSSDGAACILAVRIIGIWVPSQDDCITTAKDKLEIARPFKVSEDAQGSGPVFRTVAVEEWSQAADGVCDIRSCGHGNVVQASYELAVWCGIHPFCGSASRLDKMIIADHPPLQHVYMSLLLYL
jgi:hypothetical protein